MKKPTDIERLFQRIGLTEMRYHEFVPDHDPVRARENWSLVDSSVAIDPDDSGAHVPLSRPAPPVRRSGAFYDRVEEMRERRISRPSAPEAPPAGGEDTAAGAAAERPSPDGARRGRPLTGVFSRVRGEGAESRTEASVPQEKRPLSDVFKRLT